jgi:hypothetical protein
MARDFAAEKVAPHVIRWDQEKHFSRRDRLVASGLDRCHLDLIKTMLVADIIFSGAGPRADLAGEQRLQAGLRVVPDA